MHPPTLLLVALTTCVVTATSAATVASSHHPTPPEPSTQREGLDVPKPTGSLADEIQFYGWKLYKSCITATATVTATDVDRCPSYAASDWCGFTTAAPTSVLPAYSIYASQAYSWWMEHSSALVYMRDNCPNTWEHGRWRDGDGERWIQDTYVIAACYAEALMTAELALMGVATGGSSTTELAAMGVLMTTGLVAMGGSTAMKLAVMSLVETAVGSAAPTSTGAPSGGMGRLSAEMWVAALAGIAAVAGGYEW
ncbi:hypothetical protein VE04_02535 [Pseudogymnoascus sp. 24MN13]|nr:hypothetical protein VE04_02535 [Pseudogymnoascus sp. 24MN13]